MPSQLQLIELAGAVDGAGFSHAGCCALIEVQADAWPAVTLMALGGRDEVGSHPGAQADTVIRVDATDSVAIPGFVNAHTHLDLTHIGPRTFEIGHSFVDWVDMIRAERAADAERIHASVIDGAKRSLAGGVVAVGDIAGVFGIEAMRALASTPLVGLSGIELFGVGRRQDNVLAMLDGLETQADSIAEAAGGLGWTWQPHAPYSVGPRLYRECARRCGDRGVPMMTHLAETPEEQRFVASGDGLQRELLERLGAWDETCAAAVGRGESPVAHLQDVLARTGTIAAHVNNASDADIEALAQTNTTVAYCPRASAYFRQHEAFGPHRYREMIEAGISIALGTDSIVNLPQHESDRLSTLDEARLLVRRDGLDAAVALGMATWRGAEALGLDPEGFQFSAGGSPQQLRGIGLVKVGPDRTGTPTDWVMKSEHAAQLVRPIDSETLSL